MTKPSNLLTATTLSLAILAILVGIYDFSACDASAAELAACGEKTLIQSLSPTPSPMHSRCKIRPRATFSAIKVVYQYSHAAQLEAEAEPFLRYLEGCIHRSACPLIDGKSYTSTRHRWCRAP